MIYDDLLPTGIIRWAGNVREVTGDEPSEFENSTADAWESRIHPEDRQRAMNLRHEMMETGGRYHQEYRFRRKDGAYIVVEDHGVCLRNERGKIYRMLGAVADISERARAAQEREKLVSELQKAVSDVQTLSGLLPICANCKKIRDDRGNWTHIEEFIQERSTAQFSHGICPECTKKLYADLA
jgi:PAS domain S-box-containing protein